MCSECGSAIHVSTLTDRKYPVVALVGRSNVGKSTLFTRIAGVHRKMGNWPSTTVEVGSAEVALADRTITLLDLPGTASIHPGSPDEALTTQVLREGNPDLVVLLIDCASMARCLYLLSEVQELTSNIVIALSMEDVAVRRGIHVDPKILSDVLALPVVSINPRRAEGIEELKSQISASIAQPAAASTATSRVSLSSPIERVEWVNTVIERVSTRTQVRETRTDRVDRILTAPVWGPMVLLAVLWTVFQGTTSIATPIQRWMGREITQYLAEPTAHWLAHIHWLQGLVVNGVIAGVGTLLTFLPVMSIMFLFLSFLEDSGYMARAAVVADRAMRFAGLPGRAILPLLVGFGCNVPAVSATRSLSDSRHRLIVGLSVPFTACSARLAVYVFVAGIFFGHSAGTIIFLMYLISIALVVIFARLISIFLIKDAPREPMLIELPPYRVPTSFLILTDAWLRVKGFLREAGGIVVSTVIAVWVLMSIPIGGVGTFGNVPVDHSAYGTLSRAIAPAFAPAGFNDWHTSGALITGFVAKEVVISSWAQNYAVSSNNKSEQQQALGANLVRDFTRTSHGHAHAAIWAFLIFLTAYTPCVATVAAQKREFGTKWALVGVGLQITLAWTLAVIVFQVGRLIS
jgi:ferrous iron transport protein B